MNWQPILEQIHLITGQTVTQVTASRLMGGDISAAYRLQTEQFVYFIKLNRPEQFAMFQAEAAGLQQLAATHRPLEVQAAMLQVSPLDDLTFFKTIVLEVVVVSFQVQLTKLESFNACRRSNYSRIKTVFEDLNICGRFLSLMKESDGTDPAWFGIGAVLNAEYVHQRDDFLRHLEEKGVEISR